MEPSSLVESLIDTRATLSVHEEREVRARFSEVIKEAKESDHPLSSLVNERAADYWLQQLLAKERVAACRDTSGNLLGILVYSVEVFELGFNDVLIEHLVLPVEKELIGFGRAALEILDFLAKEHDCKMICTGNALSVNQKLTENLYTRKGSFQFSHQNFIKVL